MGTVNQVVSTLHILQVLNQKNSMQTMGLRQGSNPSCPSICSRGTNIMLPYPALWTRDVPAQHIFPVWKAFPTWVLTQRESAGQDRDRTSTWGWQDKAAAHVPPSVQEPLLKMATDAAQLTLAVSHLEIGVPRFNLKTITHHRFTHSRYFSRLKAQVNHSSF